MLPTDAKERKAIPVYSGFICYFPDAIVEVAKVSKRGNDQHNPGAPLHWDRSKSGDELDALSRHLIDSTKTTNTLDDKIEEAAARSWRSMADLQKLCEQRDRKFAGNEIRQEAALARCARDGLELDAAHPGYLTAEQKAEYIDRLNIPSPEQRTVLGLPLDEAEKILP